MSNKLPVISGKRMIQFLTYNGYTRDRQKGSHVILVRKKEEAEELDEVVVPLHKELSVGTLKSILKGCGISVEQLRNHLQNK